MLIPQLILNSDLVYPQSHFALPPERPKPLRGHPGSSSAPTTLTTPYASQAPGLGTSTPISSHGTSKQKSVFNRNFIDEIWVSMLHDP